MTRGNGLHKAAPVVRFIHSADWQLGFQRSFFTTETQAEYARARLDAIQQCGALANREGAEFILVAGDVFESNLVDRRIVIQALDVMGSLGVPVYLLPGNHDPLDPSSVYHTKDFNDRRPDNVHVITDDEPLQIRDAVELVGVPWKSKRPGQEATRGVFDGLHPAPNGIVRIGVAHGMLDVLSPDRNDPSVLDFERLTSAVSEGRVHYIALGDHHSKHEATDRIWYSGTPEATRFSEQEPGYILLVNVTASECQVQPLTVGKWRFIKTLYEINGPQDIEGLNTWLNSIENAAQTILRLHLEGNATVAMRARVEAVVEDHTDRFAALDWPDEPNQLVVIPDDEDFSSIQLSGFAHKAFEDLLDSIKRDQSQIDQDALVLLYLLSRRVEP